MCDEFWKALQVPPSRSIAVSLFITVFMGKLKYEVSSFCGTVLDLPNAEGKPKKKFFS